jgi:hypothetical protein
MAEGSGKLLGWGGSIPTARVQAGDAMWVIFLEAGVALFLLLIIVWATWPSKIKTPDDGNPPPPDHD